MKKDYILGVHTSHDASACLLCNGEIIVAIEKERLSREKHDLGTNGVEDVINYCLSYEGITIKDIRHIVICDIDNIFNEIVVSKKETRITHHLAHAWASVGLSNFKDSCVLVLDGEGSKVKELDPEEKSVCDFKEDFYAEKESCYYFSNGKMKPIKKWTSARGNDSKFFGTDTIGSTYLFLSQYFYKKEFQEFKVMGLSSYGKYREKYSYIYKYLDHGKVYIDPDWIFNLKNIEKNNIDNNFNEYADLAKSIQIMLEKSVIHKAKWLKETNLSENLCYSGGVSLNCVANSELKKNEIFKNVFIPFGSGDSSISIGCAFYGYYHLLGNKKKNNSISPFLGREYKKNKIKKDIKNYEDLGIITSSKMSIKDTANKINNNNIIAWFQGRSEFGPRALGNRSILANPMDINTRNTINNKVKFREEYRPFAPVVLEEHAEDWFEEIFIEDHYMQSVAKVRSEKRKIIPSVTHIDNTARVQIVTKKTNSKLYDLINEFYNLTGVPILLNTSFNIQEPIVETPFEALKTFTSSRIDNLIINEFSIRSLVTPIDKASDIDLNCILLWNVPITLLSENNNIFYIQNASGIEYGFKYSNCCYHQVSQYKKIRITKKLYLVLLNMDTSINNIIKNQIINFISSSCTDEFYKVIVLNRFATVIKKRSLIL